MDLSRRSFLRLSVAGSGTLAIAWTLKAIPGALPGVDALSERNLHRDFPEEFVASACNACPGGCGVVLRRIGGRIVGVRPTDPKPCCKAYVIPQELVHPDRVRGYGKRAGERGKASWAQSDAAAAADALVQLLRDAGPKTAIVVREDSGLSPAILQAMFAAAGSTFVATAEWTQHHPPVDALAEATGWREWRFDLLNCGGVVSFGWDWLQSYENPRDAAQAWRRLREKHLPMAHVGPRLSVTAMRSKEWVACRPGGETAAALALAFHLVKANLHDPAAAAWAAEVAKLDIAGLEAAAGIPAGRMLAVARLFRESRPVCIASRRSIEEQRAVTALNALLGHVGKPGGLLPLPAAAFPVAVTEQPVEDLPAAVEDGRIEHVVLAGVNPVFDSPAPARWRAALAKAKTVVAVSSWHNETTALADWLIPLSTSAEAREAFLDEIGGKLVPRFIDAAVPGTPASAADLAFAVAAKLKPKGFPWKTLDTAARAVKTTPAKVEPFRFPATAWTPPAAPPAGEFHLELDLPEGVVRGHGHQHPWLLTTVAPHLRESWTTWLEINPAAAARLGLKDGDWAVVSAGNASIRARARFYKGVPENTVTLPLGVGHAGGSFPQKDGGNAAELVAFRRDAASLRPLWNTQTVRIARA